MKYIVQSTPASFNTPLGISKFINKELNSKTQFLILEYGARKIGDIDKLCKLFGADCGIITTIAPQHIETFKTIENIRLAKKELPDFLKDKLCVYNLDNPFVKTMFDEKNGLKIGIYSDETCKLEGSKTLDFSHIHNAYSASNYSSNNFETTFNINLCNEKLTISTKLLGKQNITNILLAVAMAKHLNIPNKLIVEGIKNVTPISHRLEHIKSFFNIIDDSYNCSISSAMYALDFLKSLNNKKMVVTPGIVEGGKSQFEINHKLGEMLAEFDYVVIVGEHNKLAIIKGIESIKKSAKTLANNIYYIKNLDEISSLYHLLTKDDAILFLNDLPDDYN